MGVFRAALSTREPDRELSALENAGVDIRPGLDGFRLGGVAAGDERFCAARVEFGGSGTASLTNPKSVIVGQVLDGGCDVWSGCTRVNPHRPFLIAGSARARWTQPFTLQVLTVRGDRLDEIAGRHFGAPGVHVRFDGPAPVDDAHGRALEAAVASVRDQILPGDGMLDDDLVREGALHLLVALLLATFPNRTQELRPTGDETNVLPSSVRRAIAFMAEHIAEPITINDVADAARLSPRGIQEAFRRSLRRAPIDYLREMRLSAAHADLVGTDPRAGVTVEVIARRWGFSHMSRFSAQHQALFGELPRETIRR